MIFHPKVSIVIPVYNGSNYLKEAINSALAQTYKNIEIIVVNDGSNDEGATESIAKSYGKKIKYYAKENGGVATALNLGIKKMTGEYFSWLSHDDLYYQDKIEKQIKFLASLKDKKVFLYSNYSILRDGLIAPVVQDHEMLVRKSKYSLLRGCVNGITIMIPKIILDEMGDFNKELRCTQDYDYWRRIEAKYDFIHMEDVLSITRLHSAQDSVVSPKVIAEGDDLWIDMVKKLTNSDKTKLEGTVYNFYYEMVKFLETTPYAGVLSYCRAELDKLSKKLKAEEFHPKVSVVIPFYNRIDKTINAVESTLNQSYKNIEIILVNDCSTDNISKVEQLIKGFDNVSIISLEHNSGPASARNLGIKKSTGEYIAFLDSDDEFMPDKIEKQLALMSKHNLDISYTSYIRRDNEQDVVMRNPALTGIVVPGIISNCTIATPTVIIRKSLLIDNRLSFDETLRVGEDTCLWLDIAKQHEILLVDEPLTVVNVDDSTHIRDKKSLIPGIKNIILYLLNDGYYTKFNYDISVLCNYLFDINSEVCQMQNHKLLNDGPVVSVSSVPQNDLPSNKRNIVNHVRHSIPYRGARKIYRSTKRVTLKVSKSIQGTERHGG